MTGRGSSDVGAIVPAAVTDRDASALRVVSYNVRDLLQDRDAVAHVVRSCRADLVCLQEAPRHRLTAHRLRRLVRESGLRWAAGGRASGGTALLVHRRLDLLEAQASALPVAGPLTRRRGYALARVADPGGGRLTVVSVHLPLRASERAAHAAQVLDRLRPSPSRPVVGGFVVAGDLNEPPQGPVWAQLDELVHDAALLVQPGDSPTAPTYPAGAPRQRIDAVLVSQGIRVLSVRVAGRLDGLDAGVLAAASDHLPLVVDLVVSSAFTQGSARATLG